MAHVRSRARPSGLGWGLGAVRTNEASEAERLVRSRSATARWGSARLPGSQPCQRQQRTRCRFSAVKPPSAYAHPRSGASAGPFCRLLEPAVSPQRRWRQQAGGAPWAGFPWGCRRTAASRRGWAGTCAGTVGLCAGVEFNGLQIVFGDVEGKAKTRVRQLGDSPLMLLARGWAGWGSPAKLRRTRGSVPAPLPEKILSGGKARGWRARVLGGTPAAAMVLHSSPRRGAAPGGSTCLEPSSGGWQR